MVPTGLTSPRKVAITPNHTTLLKLPAFATTALLAAAIIPPPARAAAPTITVEIISEAGAAQVIAAARRAAIRLHAPCAIAVVSPSGILVAFNAMDGVRAGSPDLAIGKARTSALLERPSAEVETNTNGGRFAMATAGLVLLRGGMPILVHGHTIGAIGIAGLSKDHDVAIANEAAAAIAGPPPPDTTR